MKYCPDCASRLELKCLDGIDRKACPSPGCGFVHWDNPVPVVAALVQYQGKVVLARNSQWPEGMFSLVTGYLERSETPEGAVVREVKEELGLNGEVQDFIGCYSFAEKNQIILAHSGSFGGGNRRAENRKRTVRGQVVVSGRTRALAVWPVGADFRHHEALVRENRAGQGAPADTWPRART